MTKPTTDKPADNTTGYLADTTIVYYRLHNSAVFAKVKEAIGTGLITITNFVRGEYIRGYVIALTEMYATIKEENHVWNGIMLFLAEEKLHPRKLFNAVSSFQAWILGHEDYEDVKKTLRRLGDHIRNLVFEFDDIFVTRMKDSLACDFGVLDFRKRAYSEDEILDFYQDYRQALERPSCRQCEFRAEKQSELNAEGIELIGAESQAQFSGSQHEGFVSQVKYLQKAVKSKLPSASCWYCQRLGDSIIALAAPHDKAILTSDAKSFVALAAVLRKPLKLVPVA